MAALIVHAQIGQKIFIIINYLYLFRKNVSRHITYDEDEERGVGLLSEKLPYGHILQRYSRLTIDCDHLLGSARSITNLSDSVIITQRSAISKADHLTRERAIFDYSATACQAHLRLTHIRSAFSIHCFTPNIGTINRPWDIRFLHNHQNSQDNRLVRASFPEPSRLSGNMSEIWTDHLLDGRRYEDWVDQFHILLPKFMEKTNDINPQSTTGS